MTRLPARSRSRGGMVRRAARAFAGCHRSPAPSFGRGCLTSRSRPLVRSSPARRRLRLGGQRLRRSGGRAFPAKRLSRGPAPLGSGLAPRRRAMTERVSARCASPCLARGLTPRGRRQIYARTPGLGQPNGDRLLARACSVLACADMLHLLADELASLSGWRLPLLLVPTCSLQSLPVWHVQLLLAG